MGSLKTMRGLRKMRAANQPMKRLLIFFARTFALI